MRTRWRARPGVPKRVLRVHAAGDPQLAGRPSGPAFSTSTATANQEPGADVALEQRAGRHRQPVGRRRRRHRRGSSATSRNSATRRARRRARDRAWTGGGHSGSSARAGVEVERSTRRPPEKLHASPPDRARSGRPARGGRRTAPIVRCRRPRDRPSTRAHRVAIAPRRSRAPRGTRARDPTVPRPPLRPRGRRGPGRGRRPAVRRHRAGAPPGAARAASAATPSGSTCRRCEPGEDPDERYRRAARTLAAWRSDGTLRKDPRALGLRLRAGVPRARDTGIERTQRGFFARLRIEPFGPGSGVLPHERTLSGPKEDRYRLLRATGHQHVARRGPLRGSPPGRPRRCWRRSPPGRRSPT